MWDGGGWGCAHPGASLLLPRLLPAAGMAFQPYWHMLDPANSPSDAPDFISSKAQPWSVDFNWWRGLRGGLSPLFKVAKVHCVVEGKARVRALKGDFLSALEDGDWKDPLEPLPPNTQTLVDGLHTQCFLVQDCNRWFQGQDVFKPQPHGHSMYIKARAGRLAQDTKEVYVHTLLCHMYNGPPPTNSFKHVAGHLCEHKHCICPWHLAWMREGENKARHLARAKMRRFVDA